MRKLAWGLRYRVETIKRRSAIKGFRREKSAVAMEWSEQDKLYTVGHKNIKTLLLFR